MVQLAVFPHAMGVTAGMRAFVNALADDGHEVQLVDLYDGIVCDDLDAGIEHANEIGFSTVIDRGVAAIEPDATGVVVIGFSLGVLPAQKLAQTHPGVIGAVLCDAAVPADAFGGWRDGVRAAIHLCADDPLVAEDLAAAAELATRDEIELTIHPGAGHVAIDASGPAYDPDLARHLRAEIRAFVEAL